MNQKQTVLERSEVASYAPTRAKIVFIREVTAYEKFFRIELDGRRNLEHRPGQFVMVSLFGYGEAPISVCSSPTQDGFFELTVRRMGTVTTAMHRLKAGDTLGIRGPFGNGFPVERMAGNDILIVAGGLGIVPLRSLIRFILDRRQDFGEVAVLLGCKTPKDMLFSDEIASWRERADIKFACTVDRADPDWKGNVGLITGLIPGVSIAPQQTFAVIVGPPVMYKFVILKLLEKEMPYERIIVSLERKMRCGLGKCGHCQIRGVYICQSGPVFTFKELQALEGECHEGECKIQREVG